MTTAKTICTVCNYIYDEGLGEPGQDILPSIAFENLAEDWQCPECGSAKEMFQPCSCVSYSIYEQTCIAHREGGITSGAQAVDGDSALSKSTSVGAIVAQRPARACVLEQLGIDYCCGGKVSLEEACLKKKLDVEEVLEKLRDVEDKNDERDWNKADLQELVDHIITDYHQPLRQELIRIKQLAEKVARVHGDTHPEMIEVLNVFDQFKAKLELHMQKEEMVLFPGIKAMEATGTPQIFGCGGGIEHPIEVMTLEHDEAGEALCTIRRLTNDFAPPADACGTFKVLLYSLAQIESEMHQHVHKENNILFPRALALRQAAPASR